MADMGYVQLAQVKVSVVGLTCCCLLWMAGPVVTTAPLKAVCTNAVLY